MTTPPRVRFAPSPTGLLHVRLVLTSSHSGPEFDKLIPLIEDGSALGLGVPSVSERIERFVGV